MCSTNKKQSGVVDVEALYLQTSNLDKRRLLQSAKGVELNPDVLSQFVTKLVWDSKIENKHDYTKIMRQLQTEFKIHPTNCNLNYMYKCLLSQHPDRNRNSLIENFMRGKKVRETSGVIVFTVLTSGIRGFKDSANHGCQWNCYYCPDQPGMPRSYLRNEPAVARADNNDFDAVRQIHDRATVLFLLGKHIDKIEIIVEGGTIASYKKDYLLEFMRDLYYAFNIFYTPIDQRRPPLSLEEEIMINETCLSRVIGVTLETRPDCLNLEELTFYRQLGCTRIQVGVQHTDDQILKLINRGCQTKTVYEGLELAKNCGFKLDAHWMLDLPGSSPEQDIKMLKEVLTDHRLQFDDWKIYPCQTTDYTVIQKWFQEGKYVPYSHDVDVYQNKDPNNTNLRKLIDVCKWVKKRIHPWIRINRLIRDIPNSYIEAGIFRGDLRHIIQEELHWEGTPCQCIRCREVKDGQLKIDIQNLNKTVRVYEGSHGIEYFISLESDENVLYGFVRLRLCYQPGASIFPELMGSALVRELHVYGQMVPVWDKDNVEQTQHRGIGQMLMRWAEEIAIQHQYRKIAVISGVGVRRYYQNKCGYHQEGTYMVKELSGSITPTYETLHDWKKPQWGLVKETPVIYPSEFKGGRNLPSWMSPVLKFVFNVLFIVSVYVVLFPLIFSD